MAIVSRDQIKSWFRRGLKPLEVHFASWIDSFWHKNDTLPMSSIDGLTTALNERTFSIDDALSDSSENPVQNKIVKAALDGKAPASHTHTIASISNLQEELSGKASTDTTNDLQRQIDLLAQSGSGEKEVVAVATYSDLEEIAEPSQEIIYKTLDTNKLYLYDGEDFEDVTGRPIDNTIYISDISELLTAVIDEGMYAVLCVTTSGGNTTVSASYTLTVTSSTRLLQDKDGWAERVSVNGSYQWSWHRYSYEGHTHNYAAADHTHAQYLTAHQDISGKQDVIADLATIRSNAALAARRSYTLDFGTAEELIQDVNMLGAITINALQPRNIAHLYITYGAVAHQEIDLTQTVSLNIPNGTIITWEIVRTTDDGLACLGVGCIINS